MHLNVYKGSLLLFAILLIAGTKSQAQTMQEFCALRVLVNDPFAQIFVDNKKLGQQPQLINCSDQERNIVVKSSDGQIFSRSMKSAKEFDTSNATLNIVFHKNANQYYHNNDIRDLSAVKSVENGERTSNLNSTLQAETPAKSTEEINFNAFVPSKGPAQVQQAREVSSSSKSVSKTSGPQQLSGTYVQLSALKNFDVDKVKKEFSQYDHQKISGLEVTVCPSYSWSLILVGPFEKSEALEIKKLAGRESFIVTNPGCTKSSLKMRP